MVMISGSTLRNIVVLVVSLTICGLILGCGKLEDDSGASPIDPAAFSVPSDTYPTPGPTPQPTVSPGTTTPLNVLVNESLTDGRTTGQLSNAALTPGGAQLRGTEGYIRYSIPTTPHGYIEFSARGFQQNEIHGGSEFKGVLVTMWSGNDGYDYENAPFVFELRKYGFIEGRPDASNSMFFKIKSNGTWETSEYHVMSWNPSQTYRFRIEWGGGRAMVWRDGYLETSGTYSAEFHPSNHQIQIGANPLRAKESPANLLISNVVVGAR